MSQIVAWTQWPDLIGPTGVEMRSTHNFPLESSNLAEITFYVPTYFSGQQGLNFIKQMSNLNTLQLPNAGYEDAIPYLRPGLTLCNASGVHDASTAELAVGLAIASRRGFPEFMRNQSDSTWHHKRWRSLSDSKIGIIGYGSIGQKIGKNLSGFEVEVMGFSRSARDGSRPISELDQHLPSLDIVILILPLNEESHHLFDARRLSLMKDGALIVNVARGPIIETDALLAELTNGRLFAALDVTDPEPLPPEHPLWNAKNALILPHVGGDSTAFEPRCRKLIHDQLELLLAGEPLKNIIVDGEGGK